MAQHVNLLAVSQGKVLGDYLRLPNIPSFSKKNPPLKVDSEATTLPVPYRLRNFVIAGNSPAFLEILKTAAEVDLSAQDALGEKMGLTHYAAFFGREEILRELLRKLDKPVDSFLDKTGRTPLHYAFMDNAEKKQDDMINCLTLLINRGASVDLRTSDGKIPGDYSVDEDLKEDIVRFSAEKKTRAKAKSQTPNPAPAEEAVPMQVDTQSPQNASPEETPPASPVEPNEQTAETLDDSLIVAPSAPSVVLDTRESGDENKGSLATWGDSYSLGSPSETANQSSSQGTPAPSKVPLKKGKKVEWSVDVYSEPGVLSNGLLKFIPPGRHLKFNFLRSSPPPGKEGDLAIGILPRNSPTWWQNVPQQMRDTLKGRYRHSMIVLLRQKNLEKPDNDRDFGTPFVFLREYTNQGVFAQAPENTTTGARLAEYLTTLLAGEVSQASQINTPPLFEPWKRKSPSPKPASPKRTPSQSPAPPSSPLVATQPVYTQPLGDLSILPPSAPKEQKVASPKGQTSDVEMDDVLEDPRSETMEDAEEPEESQNDQGSGDNEWTSGQPQVWSESESDEEKHEKSQETPESQGSAKSEGQGENESSAGESSEENEEGEPGESMEEENEEGEPEESTEKEREEGEPEESAGKESEESEPEESKEEENEEGEPEENKEEENEEGESNTGSEPESEKGSEEEEKQSGSEENGGESASEEKGEEGDSGDDSVIELSSDNNTPSSLAPESESEKSGNGSEEDEPGSSMEVDEENDEEEEENEETSEPEEESQSQSEESGEAASPVSAPPFSSQQEENMSNNLFQTTSSELKTKLLVKIQSSDFKGYQKALQEIKKAYLKRFPGATDMEKQLSLFGREVLDTDLGDTTIHVATYYSKEILRDVLSWTTAGLALGERNGRTPLNAALREDDQEVVKLLWEADPDDQKLFRRDNEGASPLSLSLGWKEQMVAELISVAHPPSDPQILLELKYPTGKTAEKLRKLVSNTYFWGYLHQDEPKKASLLLSGDIDPFWKPVGHPTITLELACQKGSLASLEYFANNLLPEPHNLFKTPVLHHDFTGEDRIPLLKGDGGYGEPVKGKENRYRIGVPCLYWIITAGHPACAEALLRSDHRFSDELMVGLVQKLIADGKMSPAARLGVGLLTQYGSKKLLKVIWKKLSGQKEHRHSTMFATLETFFDETKEKKKETHDMQVDLPAAVSTEPKGKKKENKQDTPVAEKAVTMRIPAADPAPKPLAKQAVAIPPPISATPAGKGKGARKETPKIFSLLKGGNMDGAAKELRSAKFDASAVDEDGNTVLHHLALGANRLVSLADTILGLEGLDVNARNNNGETAFFLSCTMFAKNASLFWQLMERPETNVNLPDNQEIFPLMVLAEAANQEVMQRLVYNYQKPFAFEANGVTFEQVLSSIRGNKPASVLIARTRTMFQEKAFVDAVRSGSGPELSRVLGSIPGSKLGGLVNRYLFDTTDTALTFACRKGQYDTLSALLGGAQPDVNLVENKDQKTPLLVVCENRHISCFMELLGNPGLSEDSRNQAMRFIAESGDIELLTKWALVSKQVPQVNRSGKAFSTIAEEAGQDQAAGFLENYHSRPDIMRAQLLSMQEQTKKKRQRE